MNTLASLRLLACAAALAASAPFAGAHGDHAHGTTAASTRSEQPVTLPAVKVVRDDGRAMKLAEAIDDGRPVLLNFIYTSCNAICPLSSQVFVEVRDRLGAARDKVNMVSISIDPEQDTPQRLTEYARRFGSAGTWAHYTGSAADAVEIQRAFGAWRGDKMNHQPITFLRPAPGRPWIRLDGFFGPAAVVGELQKILTTSLAATRCDASSLPNANCRS